VGALNALSEREGGSFFSGELDDGNAGTTKAHVFVVIVLDAAHRS